MIWEPRAAPEEPVDVCLLLEGTYPYVRGGVSTWVHRLIESLPEVTFSVIFLGGRRADHGPARYPQLPNVRHFQRQYLFERPEVPAQPVRVRGRCPFADVDRLHQVLRDTDPAVKLGGDLLGALSRLLLESGGLTREDLLHGDDSWERIREGYQRRCPEGSFTDYFWTIRATHASLFAVAELARRVPPARAYHAVSTGYAGLLGALLRQRDHRPLVLTEHGIYTKERKIDLASAERLPGDGAGTSGDLASAGFGRAMWMRFFEGLGRIAYSSADQVISLYGGNQRRQIQDGADPARARIIPNGVDVARFRRLRQGRPDRPPRVLGFLGRVVPIKDVKSFVRAMKGVIARWPDAEGWIVGPTSEDEGYASECAQLAATLGLGDRVRFMGFLPPEEVLPHLGLLVLSSISEALPLVVLEAFASGLPVLTTDVGACRELVEGGTAEDRALGAAGAVVPVANPEAMADAALRLLADPERWRAAQQAGIRRVEAFYQEGQVFDAYRHIYQEARAWQA